MRPSAWLRALGILLAVLGLVLLPSVVVADDDKPDPGPPVHVDDPPALYTYTVTRLAQTFDTNFGSQLGTISGCDDCAQQVTLPFTFNFYGYNYTRVYVTSNGLLNFTSADWEYSNSIAGLRGKVAIAPLWDDWYNPGPGAVYYRGDANQAVFTWVTPHYPYAYGGMAEFQAVVHRDGRIQFNYLLNYAPTSATLGISTADTNVSTAYAVDVGSTNMMQGYLFTPGGQANRPPTVNPGGPYSVPEGGSVALSGSGSDPDNDPLTYAWDLDNNGTFETSGQTATFSAAGRDGPSNHTVVLRVCDNKNACGTSSTTVTIMNVAPTIASVTNNGPVNEGSSATVVVAATDPAGPGDPLSYEFDCNNDGTYEVGPQAGNSAACAFADNGSYTVNVRVSDGDGGAATGSTTVQVNNVAPTATFGAPASVNEGSPISLSLTGASDPSPVDTAAGFTYAFDCGSGYGAYGAASSATCPTVDNGTRTVKGKIRDKDGGASEYNASVTINNVAPTVSAGADAVLYSSQSLSVSAGFTDPGVSDAPWTYTIDWSDGPASSGSTNAQGAGTVSGSHQYFVPGTYTVKVCVTDKDNGKGCDDLTVEVKRLVVRIDIKPGSDPNSINLRSRGNVPVGILGGTYSGVALDATTIVRSTVVFAGAAALSIGGSPQDVNGDGRLDVVYHFDTQALNLTSGSTQGCLTGRTSGNVYFEGCDSVRIVQAP